jgi:hypothetical protein
MRTRFRPTIRAAAATFGLFACCAVATAQEVIFDFEQNVEGWGYTERVKGRQAQVSAERGSLGSKSSLKFEASFPGQTEVSVPLQRANWSAYGEVSLNIYLPDDAPNTTQALLFVKDRDHLWYQHLWSDYLRPGAWNHLRVPLAASAGAWEFRGHHKPWNDTSRLALLELGVRVFCKDKPFSGAVYLDKVTLHPLRQAPDPARKQAPEGFIRQLRVNATQVGQYEKFEITFQLAKEYANPFDPEEVAVDATFTTPSGEDISVPGFFYQEYMQQNSAQQEKFTPLGAAVWKVRFAPTETGKYYYRVTVRDATTVAETAQRSFVCQKSANPGFVRVWQPPDQNRTRRYFELSNGDFFFPIGHNIRSPFDLRYAQAPWANLQPRRDLGLRAYERYFRKMGDNGENFCEVWMASWWLALEWTNNAPGYHGVGQYNLLHAWKLDRLLELARANGIRLLLVINNHGKFSTWVDQEWASNPFNKINDPLNGFDSPEEFFTDPRGRRAFKNQLRYLVARWAYDTQVFGWKLFSEINLTGATREFHRSEAMRNWHREMGAYLKHIDPWKHPITSHYSGDYRTQDPRLVSLPELDFSTVDAYHGMNNALRIIELINETAIFNRQFNKPVIITEFGGSAGGARGRLLRAELHNALWASACSPTAATPLLWWWLFIDENDLYGEFKALARFMKDEDRRREPMELAADSVELLGDNSERFGVQPLVGNTTACIWIYDRDWLATATDDADAPRHQGLKLRCRLARGGAYRAEVWDTVKGTVIVEKTVQGANGIVQVDLPPFYKDIALKIRQAHNPSKQ